MNRLLDHISGIPRLSPKTTKILRVVENPTSSVQDLTEIVSHDPTLSSQILKAANSAFYGFPQKIGTVYMAIAILGFNMVRTIALNAEVLKLFCAKTPAVSSLIPTTFWEHSLKCGIACKILATNYRHCVVGEAFTAGLLHDIGRITLAYHAPRSFEKVLKFSEKKSLSLLEAEMAVLGFTHADVAGDLLEKWGLPISIVEAVRFHHFPERSQYAPDLAYVTHVADYLSHLHSFRRGEELQQPSLKSSAWESLAQLQNEQKATDALLYELSLELNKAGPFLKVLHGEA